jgi:hypothetical protein
MNLKPRKLVTIVTEASIEPKVLTDACRLGVQGYTSWDVRGKGHRGVRSGDWEGSRNVRIEIVCREEIAHELARHLLETYYDNYAMILYLSDVDVIRPEKF